MKPTARVVLALLVGIGSVVTAVVPASAASPLLADARMYAAEVNVPLAVATARLANQQVVGEFAASLQRRFPDRIAGIWMEHRPQYRMVIRLTNDSAKPIRSADPLALPTAIGVTPVHVREDATTSGLELESELARLRPWIDLNLPGVSSEIDVTTGEIVLLAGQANAPAALHIVDTMGPLTTAPLRFESYQGQVGSHNIHGGKRLSQCTSGFTVVHSSGAKGFLTAAHCDGDQTYNETSTKIYPTVYQYGIRGARHDVQWRTVPTGGNVYPRFYADSDTTPRDLLGSRGRDPQLVGDFSCHRGKTTRYSCGWLQSKTYAPPDTCGVVICANVWMRVEGSALACFGGDSGGPWFIGNIALGVHHAGLTSGTANGDCAFAVYMAINYASDLGVGTLRAN